LDAVNSILSYITSEDIAGIFKIFALFTCVGYLITQALIFYCENEDRKAAKQRLMEVKARAEELKQQLASKKSPPASSNITSAPREKGAESGDGQSAYLTNEQRALGKKLIEEAMKAG